VNDLKLYEQYQDLYLSFPKFKLQKTGNGPWFIRGILSFTREYFGHPITDEYSVEIMIPQQYPDVLPKIFEVGHRIPRHFHHYQDHSLCLGAPLEVKYKFRRDPTLLGFVNNCVIPYLYSFSYQTKFGNLPFGELSHGGLGIFQYYQDLFDIKEPRRVLELIQVLADESIQDHVKCPCGSGKRIYSCHGRILLEIKDLQTPVEFQNDYNFIVRSLVEKALEQPSRSFLY
jgi:hypothetical protein